MIFFVWMSFSDTFYHFTTHIHAFTQTLVRVKSFLGLLCELSVMTYQPLREPCIAFTFFIRFFCIPGSRGFFIVMRATDTEKISLCARVGLVTLKVLCFVFWRIKIILHQKFFFRTSFYGLVERKAVLFYSPWLFSGRWLFQRSGPDGAFAVVCRTIFSCSFLLPFTTNNSWMLIDCMLIHCSLHCCTGCSHLIITVFYWLTLLTVVLITFWLFVTRTKTLFTPFISLVLHGTHMCLRICFCFYLSLVWAWAMHALKHAKVSGCSLVTFSQNSLCTETPI